MISDEAHKQYLRLKEIRKKLQGKPKPRLVITPIEPKHPKSQENKGHGS